MKIKNNISYLSKLLFPILLVSFLLMAFKGNVENGGKKKNNSPQSLAGDAYRFFINNLDMPLNRTGVIANVDAGSGEGGKLDGIVFLFSGGFLLSGYTDGFLWTNGAASASRIEDYTPGSISKWGDINLARTDNKAQIYVLRARDGDFSESWTEWKDAVELGAYFYDGDGDGFYNPVDKNGNGKWDTDEDRPDLIGDETVWCVYNDGLDPALRRYNDVPPQGIEIRQTVFGFSSRGPVGNMIFIRYSILNTGSKADVLDSVYFSAWADPDLGEATDDLVGSDTIRNAGYVYNDGDDGQFGVNPPVFLIDFFQGPISYIPGETFVDANNNGIYDEGETPLDTAYQINGIIRGKGIFPGARNMGISSFMQYVNDASNPVHDPDTRIEARNLMLGKTNAGGNINPCTWTFGTVIGQNCADVNPAFMYSGDPVTQTGWINNTGVDQRQMSTTGPFKLEKGKPVDIVVAYVIGRGRNALNSITVGKQNDDLAQIVFDNNFPSPPPPPPIDVKIETGDGFIDISWPTSEHLTYRGLDTVLDVDRRTQGYYITSYRTNSKQQQVQGVDNAELVANYEVDNFIKSIYRVASNGGQDLVIEEAPFKLDSMTYSDPQKGRIKFRLTTDPFTGNPFVKGKEYYFAVTNYTLNHSAIVERESNIYGPTGDYLDATGSALEEFETQIIPVQYGKDLYSPATNDFLAQQSLGAANGKVNVLVANKEALTGDTYTVEFGERDTTIALYTPFWSLKNNRTGNYLIQNSNEYNSDTTDYSGEPKEGILVRIKPVIPEHNSLGTMLYNNKKIGEEENLWFKNFNNISNNTGITYVGKDIPQGLPLTDFSGSGKFSQSTAIDAGKLKRIELRFGTTGKAYRYLNGYKGTALQQRNSYVYANAVTAADTVGKGSVGLLGEGFVDVPFTAWVKDDKFGEEYQLAVGFLERRTSYGGKPDGLWYPGDTITARELIFIFNAPYDPTGSQIEYTGGVFDTLNGSVTVWANPIAGFNIPANAQNITDEQRRIAKSPFFNSLYVVGFEPKIPGVIYSSGDVLAVPVKTYGYTSSDKYTFTTKTGGALTNDEKRALFEKVNVFPNPLLGFNTATSYSNSNPDEPFVTFSNLPRDVTIKIFTLSGSLIRTLTTEDKSFPDSPFINWDLKNEDDLRVASGMYLAIVNAPGYGEKILKIAIVMPQKQIQNY